MLRQRMAALLNAPQIGLVGVILTLGTLLSVFAGSFEKGGRSVNVFLNPDSLLQIGSDASFFAIMAVGMTVVIISGGIDLSVGSIYALCGVLTAILLRSQPAFRGEDPSFGQFAVAASVCVGIGLLAGFLNGLLVSRLRVHPFIITLGTMWVFRAIAFIASGGLSINFPEGLTGVLKATLGLEKGLFPVPMLLMLLVTVLGTVYLGRTGIGRRVYAVGGNEEASRYAGLPIPRIQTGVYALNGLLAGVAAFAGSSFYGAASSADATGYELFVIASAVVGGASLIGGKGTALGAMLGALLIVMIRQAVRILHFDQNYESIVIGCALIFAVVLDQASSRLRSGRMAK